MIENRPDLSALNLKMQGHYKRVLFVCSGGMNRSATAAHWGASVMRWNTRSCGTHPAALPPVHPNLIEWATVIYCMEQEHLSVLKRCFPWARSKMQVLDIPDDFEYRSSALLHILNKKLGEGT